MTTSTGTDVPFIDLRAQYRTILGEIQVAIMSVLDGQQFVLGPEVEAFEGEFAAFVGATDAIGVSSGLDALRLALAGLGIGQGDEVIVPASTFIATALAVSAVGARPVLVDCEPGTGNMDPERFFGAVTQRTRAVIPVHLAGQPADMDRILEVAQKRNIEVIEDAAQAHGALYKGRPCGSLGVAAAFSFYPGKNLGGYGDGGMVTVRDVALAGKLRRLRNYGQSVKYQHVEQGLNARLDSLQAAVLRVKLRHLSRWNQARAFHASRYRDALFAVGDLELPQLTPGCTHVYHLFQVETEKRDELQRHLKADGIETGIHYPIPIHLQEAYQDLGYKVGDFPISERRAQRTLSLPMYAELTEDQVSRVIESIKAFYRKK